jgi:Skp family chaperone for outer membrane proteins
VKRASAYLTVVLGFAGMLLLAYEAGAQGPGGGGGTPPAPTATAARPTIAVFNMAAVMRDYGKAQYEVYQLNKQRTELSADLNKWRAEYQQKHNEMQVQQVPKLKEELSRELFQLAQKIEAKDREVSEALNKKATTIISQLYDDIKLVVDRTAELNGYHIVFAYPDAVGAEEMNNPVIKELKLKPPAAQPFYVAKQVDVTGVVVQTLNAWYPSPPVPKDNPAPAPGTTGLPSATGGATPTGGVPPTGGLPPKR